MTVLGLNLSDNQEAIEHKKIIFQAISDGATNGWELVSILGEKKR